jgi:hypothetical protein
MSTLWKSAIILLAGCLCVSAQTPEPKTIDPAKAAAIEEMLALNHADQTIKTILDQYKMVLKSQLEEALARNGGADTSAFRSELETFEGRVFDLLADRLRWERLKPMFVSIYDGTLTLEEVQGINAFYKSPAGQALLAKQPALITQSIQKTQQLMVDTGPEVQKMAREFMEEMKKREEQAH